MSNHSITQRGTQAKGLGVMIGRCSPDSQHGRLGCHPTNVGCSFFRYTKDDETNHNEQRPKRRTWTREENQFALECYFRGNLSQRRYRKRLIKVWQERSTFQTTSQRLSDQVRTIIKKRWFSDLELQEIQQKHWNKTITQYQTHQVVSNKHNPTKKNHKPRQMKTLHSQTTHYQITRKKHYHKNKR